MRHVEDSELPGCSVIALSFLLGFLAWAYAFFAMTGI